MCGITGFVDRSNVTPDLALLQRMSGAIAHRGPDDCGHFVNQGVGLGHRRLSIIDLSTHGHQPMSNEDGTIWLVYNGEIYNYEAIADQLKKKGHTFGSNSDSEVIIHAYEEFGTECLKLFNGMFAFALWDSVKKRLFSARDRVGIKPFYYHYDGVTLVFGSEIKSLLHHPSVPQQPDVDIIRRYLLLGSTISDDTWYRGIKQLPPGSWLILQNGELTVEKYWDISYEPDYSRSFESFTDELRELLQDAVRLHLRSDVPVGAYLSGGIDSSTLVSIAARELNNGIHTFSAAFNEGKEFDEREFIRIVSDTYGTKHSEVTPVSSDLTTLLPTLLWHLDEPVIGAAILPMFRVSELVRNSGVKVVLGGQGGDELFGGYPPYYVSAAKNAIAEFTSGNFNSAICRELSHLPEYLLKGGAINRLINRLKPAQATIQWLRNAKNIRGEMKDIWSVALQGSPTTNSFDKASYFDLKYGLPGLLQQEDRMSMAWSIESRVPLLDYRIVEFSSKIPSWMKVRRGVLKSVLRESVRGIVPNQILDRKDKKGFPTPTGKWFAGELKGYISATLLAKELLSAEIVDPRALATMVEAHTSGKADYGHILWKVLNLEIWMRGVASGWQNVEKSH
jgi:asparagine synthase (glutamine-hydrolysing)